MRRISASAFSNRHCSLRGQTDPPRFRAKVVNFVKVAKVVNLPTRAKSTQAPTHGEGPPRKAFQPTTASQWSRTPGQIEPVAR
jgi:hypothetical protein